MTPDIEYGLSGTYTSWAEDALRNTTACAGEGHTDRVMRLFDQCDEWQLSACLY